MRDLIRIGGLFIFILFLNSCQKEEYNTDSQTDYDKEILDVINFHRDTIGLPPLVHDESIWQIANTHSENMANGNAAFGHDGITERSDQIIAVHGSGIVAENISSGKGTAEEIVNSWLASIGHKKNIEGKFTLTGLSAIKSADGKWYYTQIFYYPN